MHDADIVVMYKLIGMVLSHFPQHELTEDAKVEYGGEGARFTLSQCLRSAEVGNVLGMRMGDLPLASIAYKHRSIHGKE